MDDLLIRLFELLGSHRNKKAVDFDIDLLEHTHGQSCQCLPEKGTSIRDVKTLLYLLVQFTALSWCSENC